jgi:hypothetical protein
MVRFLVHLFWFSILWFAMFPGLVRARRDERRKTKANRWGAHGWGRARVGAGVAYLDDVALVGLPTVVLHCFFFIRGSYVFNLALLYHNCASGGRSESAFLEDMTL